MLLAWVLILVVGGCAPKPRLLLTLTDAPPQVRDRFLPHSDSPAFTRGEIRCRYVGTETLPSSKSSTSVIDPLSIAGAVGTVYNVPVGPLTRTVFRDAATGLVPTIVDDAARLACTVDARLVSFQLHFKKQTKGHVADCRVEYQVDFLHYQGHESVLRKRIAGSAQSSFDGATVPDAVWIAVYQASADWLAAAKDSPEVAAALRAIPAKERLEVDARIVSVNSGKNVAHAQATGYSMTHVRKVATDLAHDLLHTWKPSEGKPTIAVIAFEMSGPKAREQELGPRLADMLTTALGDLAGDQIEIIERKQLVKLLHERDLTEADLVNLPDETRGKLQGVSYLVFGSVSYYVSQTR